ncbi:hypothetical protein E5288_WYG010957 [Bos mutus]|uniref:Uncharacterized protein n=1 Tax=Bos mutus TaxID=72004 RepID=A0A6B0QZI9_9CETA|nr:hypothetical protein [Bos mutus]
MLRSPESFGFLQTGQTWREREGEDLRLGVVEGTVRWEGKQHYAHFIVGKTNERLGQQSPSEAISPFSSFYTHMYHDSYAPPFTTPNNCWMAFGVVENSASSFCHTGTGKISQISRLQLVLRGIPLEKMKRSILLPIQFPRGPYCEYSAHGPPLPILCANSCAGGEKLIGILGSRYPYSSGTSETQTSCICGSSILKAERTQHPYPPPNHPGMVKAETTSLLTKELQKTGDLKVVLGSEDIAVGVTQPDGCSPTLIRAHQEETRSVLSTVYNRHGFEITPFLPIEFCTTCSPVLPNEAVNIAVLPLICTLMQTGLQQQDDYENRLEPSGKAQSHALTWVKPKRGTMLDTENMKMKDNLFELKEVIENKLSSPCQTTKLLQDFHDIQDSMSLQITARPHPRTCNDHKARVPQDTIWTRNQDFHKYDVARQVIPEMQEEQEYQILNLKSQTVQIVKEPK